MSPDHLGDNVLGLDLGANLRDFTVAPFRSEIYLAAAVPSGIQTAAVPDLGHSTLLPTGFFPAAVALDGRGESLLAANPTLHGSLALLYLGVFGSIIAFSTYVWLLHHVRPALVSSYAYVNPAIAVALGAWLAGERFSAHDLGAMAVILAGVVTITVARVLRR